MFSVKILTCQNFDKNRKKKKKIFSKKGKKKKKIFDFWDCLWLVPRCAPKLHSKTVFEILKKINLKTNPKRIPNA